MRRFIPFLFLTVAVLIAIGAFVTTHGAAVLRAKLDHFDWRALTGQEEGAIETLEVTT